MSEYGLILNLDVIDRLSESERRGFWPALECGSLYGLLQARPDLAISEDFAPHKFSGVVPELLLRMAESLNRPLRTEPSQTFLDPETKEPWTTAIFGPSDPVPNWLAAVNKGREEEGKANG